MVSILSKSVFDHTSFAKKKRPLSEASWHNSQPDYYLTTFSKVAR